MMMQMLAAGGMAVLTDGQRAADEDNPRGYFEYEPVKALATDSSWLRNARGKAVKVISALVAHLPPDVDFSLIWMSRKIDEVLASQRAMLERAGRPVSDREDQRLRELFLRHVEDVETLLDSRSRVTCLRVRYADAVSDPAAVAGRVNRFLGGALDAAKMAGAVDARLYRRR